MKMSAVLATNPTVTTTTKTFGDHRTLTLRSVVSTTTTMKTATATKTRGDHHTLTLKSAASTTSTPRPTMKLTVK